MKITYNVAMEIAAHEAVVRQAYKDSVGVWTWSVGITSATGHDVTRYIGKPQTLEHCLAIWVWALEKYAKAVREAFAGHDLTEAQFAAALSFHYNTGSIKSASWVGLYKAGKMAEAEKSLKSWNKAGGKVVQGLTTRRQREADLLFRGKWSHGTTMTEYTKLKSNSTVDWASAKRIDVSAQLKAALGSAPPAATDTTKQPAVRAEALKMTAPDPVATPKPAAMPTLYPGDRGDAVKALQRALNARGRTLSIDGHFGPLTLAAVRAFQEQRGLTADGIVGPKTWAALS